MIGTNNQIKNFSPTDRRNHQRVDINKKRMSAQTNYDADRVKMTNDCDLQNDKMMTIGDEKIYTGTSDAAWMERNDLMVDKIDFDCLTRMQSMMENQNSIPDKEDDLQEVKEQLLSKLQVEDLNEVEIELSGYSHKMKFTEVYEVRRLLGVGSFGVVLDVDNKLKNTNIALKMVTKQNSQHMFQQESMEQQVMQSLKHENIIIIKDILYTQDFILIEMEKVNGGTLDEFIRSHIRRIKRIEIDRMRNRNGIQTKLSDQDQDSHELTKKAVSNKTEARITENMSDIYNMTEDYNLFQENLSYSVGKNNEAIKKKPIVVPETIASEITRDILAGLWLIHEKNFIHRDLKPENILLNRINDDSNVSGSENTDDQRPVKYQAKIADFGLSAEIHANVFSGRDQINEVMGTILWMAPEQATGKRYGKRVDMWGIGIIVYQMLTGKHPFYLRGDDEETYINRIAKENIDELLSQNFKQYDISHHAQCFLRKCLARGISDRYRANQAQAHPWITRNKNDKVPVTQNQQQMLIGSEIKLRNCLSVLMFLSISKQGNNHHESSRRLQNRPQPNIDSSIGSCETLNTNNTTPSTRFKSKNSRGMSNVIFSKKLNIDQNINKAKIPTYPHTKNTREICKMKGDSSAPWNYTSKVKVEKQSSSNTQCRFSNIKKLCSFGIDENYLSRIKSNCISTDSCQTTSSKSSEDGEQKKIGARIEHNKSMIGKPKHKKSRFSLPLGDKSAPRYKAIYALNKIRDSNIYCGSPNVAEIKCRHPRSIKNKDIGIPVGNNDRNHHQALIAHTNNRYPNMRNVSSHRSQHHITNIEKRPVLGIVQTPQMIQGAINFKRQSTNQN